jgi:hypothetical protein
MVFSLQHRIGFSVGFVNTGPQAGSRILMGRNGETCPRIDEVTQFKKLILHENQGTSGKSAMTLGSQFLQVHGEHTPVGLLAKCPVAEAEARDGAGQP